LETRLSSQSLGYGTDKNKPTTTKINTRNPKIYTRNPNGRGAWTEQHYKKCQKRAAQQTTAETEL